MNVFDAMFGIFGGRGLALYLSEGRSVSGFWVTGVVLMALAGAVYGIAMGIGIDSGTAAKDAAKVGAILLMAYFLSLPVFFLAYRLLGRKEDFAQIAAVALAGILASATVMAVVSPVIFLYGIASGGSTELLYVHVALIDVAALLGIFILGNLVYRAFPEDRQGLVVPNAVGVIMMALVAVVSISFFRPFLEPSATFSVGTDRLKDSLGIGVAGKVDTALELAANSNRIKYRYQLARAEQGIERDLTVVRIGDNYHLSVHRLVIPGQALVADRTLLMLEGKTFTDFSGQMKEAPREEFSDFLEDSLPLKVFEHIEGVGYRARVEDKDGKVYYTARGTKNNLEVKVFLAPEDRSVHEVNIEARSPSGSSKLALAGVTSVLLPGDSLQSVVATEVASIQNTSDPRLKASWSAQAAAAFLEKPSSEDFPYINSSEYFSIGYPRGWGVGPWDPGRRNATFSECPESDCVRLVVGVGGLERGKGIQELLNDLRDELRSDIGNRDVITRTESMRGRQIGAAEHSYDIAEGGNIQRIHKIQYLYIGRAAKYSVIGIAPVEKFDDYRAIFGRAAESFDYLR